MNEPAGSKAPKRLAFAISADYERATGGYVYDMRMVAELEGLGWRVDGMILPGGFPQPDEEARAGAVEAFAGLPDGTLVLVESLVLAVLPEVAMTERKRLRLVALVHHPLALETGLDPARRDAALRSERTVLADVRRVIATSRTTAVALETMFDVPAGRIAVAEPGTDQGPIAPGSHGDVPALLSVGAVVPRKDHLALVRALGGLAHLPWRLRIVGNTTRSPATVVAVRAFNAEPGIAARVDLLGEIEIDALASIWRETDVFVSTSRYEGFGMAIAEALARGLPVVAVAGGAVGHWLDPAAALIVPPDDPVALREALRRVLTDAPLRGRLRQGALRARETLPSWRDTALRIDACLGAIAAD